MNVFTRELEVGEGVDVVALHTIMSAAALTIG